MKVGRFFLEHVLPFAVSSTILLGACAFQENENDNDSETLPVASISEVLNHSCYLVVDNIPEYYRNQLFDVASVNHFFLNDLRNLELKINATDDLSWLGESQNLESLSISFDGNVDSSKLRVIGELKNLCHLEIIGSKYLSFDSNQERDEYIQKVGAEKVFVVSQYDSSITVQHELLDAKDAFSFIQFLPKLEFVSLSYCSDVDNLRFLELNKNIRNIQILDSKFPVQDVESEMPFLENFPKLGGKLYLEIDGLAFTPQNIKYLGDRVDVTINTPNGFYKLDYNISDSVNYLSFSNASEFYGVDINFFKSLEGIVDTIYLQNIGAYDLAISLSGLDIDYLCEHFKVVFDSDDVTNQVKEISRILDEIIESIDIKPWDSEKARLDKILFYIKNNYSYDFDFRGLPDVEKDFQTYYQEGYLYGALTRKNIICGNYAGLATALLKRAGINSYVITGTVLAMNDDIDFVRHAWNVVLVNGEYYYLDATGIDITEENLAWYNQVLDGVGLKDNHKYLKDPMAPLSVIYKPDYIPQDLEFKRINKGNVISNIAFWASLGLASLFFIKATKNDGTGLILKPRNKKK